MKVFPEWRGEPTPSRATCKRNVRLKSSDGSRQRRLHAFMISSACFARQAGPMSNEALIRAFGMFVQPELRGSVNFEQKESGWPGGQVVRKLKMYGAVANLNRRLDGTIQANR